jgi:hypothetical protein
MLKNTNGGGGVVTSDANFNPTAISGDAWWNIQNRSTPNGIDGLGTGGRRRDVLGDVEGLQRGPGQAGVDRGARCGPDDQ